MAVRIGGLWQPCASTAKPCGTVTAQHGTAAIAEPVQLRSAVGSLTHLGACVLLWLCGCVVAPSSQQARFRGGKDVGAPVGQTDAAAGSGLGR